METTFITIHDLSPEARILYSSDSVVDILGYSPDEIVDRSCWEFFHPDELPLAQAKHGQSIMMDKAAVLSYCRMKDKDGQWLGCEIVFTVVYDVMVGCTSVYRRGLKSLSRATEAPIIRRLFSTSPRDPRYHMLSHLSSKFTTSSQEAEAHEPRAALFLNRYTRTLTVMYATDGLADVLGITGDELRGRSFYYCIDESCLQDAVKCLENAKANDSIAYLRFWYRDPRQDDPREQWQAANGEIQQGTDEEMEDVSSGDDRDLRAGSVESQPLSSTDSMEPVMASTEGQHNVPMFDSRTSSGRSSNPYSHEAVFGEENQRDSSNSSMSTSPGVTQRHLPTHRRVNNRPIELEAVVSCTSDGLVVCLRRARPLVPFPWQSPAEPTYANGLFAVPWATEPIMPSPQQRPQYAHIDHAHGLGRHAASAKPVASHSSAPRDDFMTAIRDIAVFAWALTGINGSIADYGHGRPRGEAQPPSGLPIWQPDAVHPQLPSIESISKSPGNNGADRDRMVLNGLDGGETGGGPDSEMMDGQQSSAQGFGVGAKPEYYGQAQNHQLPSPPQSRSPGGAFSYKHSPINGQRQARENSESTLSATDNVLSPNSIPFDRKGLWQPRSVQADGNADKNFAQTDGECDSPNSGNGSTTSGGGQKRIMRDPYGFGDPGLSSKNGTNVYNAGLQSVYQATGRAPYTYGE